MVIKYNVTGADRKSLVTALSMITGVKAKYLGMPSMAYEVGDFIIDKNGTLEQGGKADSEEIESVAERLASEGFTPEEETKGTEAAQTVDSGTFGLCISMPRNSFTDTALENVKAIIQVNSELIRHALQLDDLPIEITEEKVSFPWFDEMPSPEEVQAYTHFISALCEMARNQKRIMAKEKETSNEKYAFRCFLLRLGFIGKEYKEERKILLRNLSGSSAFKGGLKMKIISKEKLHHLREKYPVGCRVELLRMDDIQAPVIGTKGTVIGVDDIGSIMVSWDTGSSLSVVFGEDLCRRIDDDR